MKYCKNCMKTKDKAEFSRDRHSTDGLRRLCKSCERVYMAEYREKHKKERTAYDKTRYESNKELIRERCRERYKRDSKILSERSKEPDRRLVSRRAHLLREYGLGWSVFESMYVDQEGCCLICGNTMHVLGGVGDSSACCVDHDHGTGQVRGLLCRKCNSLIGLADDQIDQLKKAIEYLTLFQKRAAELV